MIMTRRLRGRWLCSGHSSHMEGVREDIIWYHARVGESCLMRDGDTDGDKRSGVLGNDGAVIAGGGGGDMPC